MLRLWQVTLQMSNSFYFLIGIFSPFINNVINDMVDLRYTIYNSVSIFKIPITSPFSNI